MDRVAAITHHGIPCPGVQDVITHGVVCMFLEIMTVKANTLNVRPFIVLVFAVGKVGIMANGTGFSFNFGVLVRGFMVNVRFFGVARRTQGQFIAAQQALLGTGMGSMAHGTAILFQYRLVSFAKGQVSLEPWVAFKAGFRLGDSRNGIGPGVTGSTIAVAEWFVDNGVG